MGKFLCWENYIEEENEGTWKEIQKNCWGAEKKEKVLVCYSGLGGAAGTSHEPMFQPDAVASFSLW